MDAVIESIFASGDHVQVFFRVPKTGAVITTRIDPKTAEEWSVRLGKAARESKRTATADGCDLTRIKRDLQQLATSMQQLAGKVGALEKLALVTEVRIESTPEQAEDLARLFRERFSVQPKDGFLRAGPPTPRNAELVLDREGFLGS
ncbi:MAG: hypothetical protein JWR80_7972 [Bradyrhizobium sp.]|nr:hypothetical protein [Bradyrhizobium sp.]